MVVLSKTILHAAGRLINDSVSGSISYTYSDSGCSTGTCGGGAADKVIKEGTPLGTIDYTYDAIGRRTSMTVAGQPAVNYSYDANSRLTGINTTINNVAAGFSLSYDAIGRRTSLTLPNGVKTNYNYDEGSHLLNLQHLNPVSQVLESLTYSYDATGNRTSMNRQSVSLPLRNEVTNTSYNEANQMLKYNASSDNMTYDENGNLTSITNGCGTTTYNWDVRNRLVGINGFNTDCSALSASFKYDALGRRIEKTINSKTTQYLYDGMDIVQEIENSAVSANYIRTLNIDEPLARVKADGTVRYYQTDALGSVIAMTDEAGTVKTQYAYDSYGDTTVTGEASDNPFQYTGRENDGTGLYYYRARYYSPELQRFVSEDPIRLKSGDINFFSYVGNRPVNLRDPSGLAGWFFGGGSGGVHIGPFGFNCSLYTGISTRGEVCSFTTCCLRTGFGIYGGASLLIGGGGIGGGGGSNCGSGMGGPSGGGGFDVASPGGPGFGGSAGWSGSGFAGQGGGGRMGYGGGFSIGGEVCWTTVNGCINTPGDCGCKK